MNQGSESVDAFLAATTPSSIPDSADHAPFGVSMEYVKELILRDVSELDSIIQSRPDDIIVHCYRAVKEYGGYLSEYIPDLEGKLVGDAVAMFMSNLVHDVTSEDRYKPNVLFFADVSEAHGYNKMSDIYIRDLERILGETRYNFGNNYKDKFNIINGPEEGYNAHDTLTELEQYISYIQPLDEFPDDYERKAIAIARAFHVPRVEYLARVKGLDIRVISIEAIMLRAMQAAGFSIENVLADFTDLDESVKAEHWKMLFMRLFDRRGRLASTFSGKFPRQKDKVLTFLGNKKK